MFSWGSGSRAQIQLPRLVERETGRSQAAVTIDSHRPALRTSAGTQVPLRSLGDAAPHTLRGDDVLPESQVTSGVGTAPVRAHTPHRPRGSALTATGPHLPTPARPLLPSPEGTPHARPSTATFKGFSWLLAFWTFCVIPESLRAPNGAIHQPLKGTARQSWSPGSALTLLSPLVSGAQFLKKSLFFFSEI